MSANSAIEWTETTWNPVVGCRKVSAGCTNCYAEKMANRLSGMAASARRAGHHPGRKRYYQEVVDARGRWNGTVQLAVEAIDSPRAWKRSRLIFVNSMSDLFHEDVPFSFIAKIFSTMVDCPQHTFQILTKRPSRAAELAGKLPWRSNVWMGTSVEDAAAADRIGELLEVPAHVKFLSLEPLLGPLDQLRLCGIDWVIVGGESGAGARPMCKSWVYDIRDACVANKVPFFFKQWGGANKKKTGRLLDGRTWDQMPKLREP